MEIRTTRRGLRLVHGRHVLSEVLARPGPTHSVFDVLAATVAALSNGPRVLLLGFAGGGMIAPLRALGCTERVDGVDLDLTGVRLFRRVGRDWSGEVRVVKEDALAAVKRERRVPFVIEDLSVQLDDGDVVKPPISFSPLPGLIARRLAADGAAVFNLLPQPGRTWLSLEREVAAPFAAVRVIHLEEFENRILIGARALPDPAALGYQLRGVLELIGSRIGPTLRVHQRR